MKRAVFSWTPSKEMFEETRQNLKGDMPLRSIIEYESGPPGGI